MRWILTAVALALAVGCAKSPAVIAVPELATYELSTEVEKSLVTLGGESDILIIGETHGTQEVPAVVESLLAPLTEAGYRALALEIPHDEQSALVAWATGTTRVVPTFFAEPGPDGRANEQLLALVRRALRPPYQWKLICFDGTEAEMMQLAMERLPRDAKGNIAELAAAMSFDDVIALGVQRDAKMAENFTAELGNLPTGVKVLAICGNVHARTADHAPADSPIKALWPSFAAVLKRDHPNWKTGSLNVQAFGGEYFNGGAVQRFTERPLDGVAFRRTVDADWDAELSLPRATAATFLKTPHN